MAAKKNQYLQASLIYQTIVIKHIDVHASSKALAACLMLLGTPLFYIMGIFVSPHPLLFGYIMVAAMSSYIVFAAFFIAYNLLCKVSNGITISCLMT